MQEVLILPLIYLTGVLFGLLFVKRIPALFAYFSGFLWGSLIWVLAALLVSLVPGLYSLGSMLAALGLVWVILFIFYRWLGLLTQVGVRLWQVGVAGVIFALICGGLYWLNGMAGTPDSAMMMVMARVIARDGAGIGTQWVGASPAGFGIYAPAIHSIGFLLNGLPLRSFHPLLMLSLMATFWQMAWLAGGRLGVSGWMRGTLVGLSAAWLVSAPLMIYQTVYVHTNLAAAVFLFAAGGAAWLMLAEGNPAWLWFVMLGLTGFSLSRTETPIFALMFLGLLLGRIPYRQRLKAFLPYLVFISIWLFSIANMKIGAYLDILDTTSLLIMAGLNLLCAVFVMVSGLRWVEEKLLPRLVWIEAGLFVLVLAGMALLKPEQMMTSFLSLISNLTVTGEWGLTWVLLFILLGLVSLEVHLPYESLIGAFVPLFLGLILMVGFLSKSPFHIGFVDSANRMATAALPLLVFYVLLKLMIHIQQKASR